MYISLLHNRNLRENFLYSLNSILNSKNIFYICLTKLFYTGNRDYDDHCRVCHRLGDLLCCETCPAVFHLECVEPPLVDVPPEDWQCSTCKAHKISGIVDCIPDVEKNGLLCRQEHLGFDRHGRKYWFLVRRVFVYVFDSK